MNLKIVPTKIYFPQKYIRDYFYNLIFTISSSSLQSSSEDCPNSFYHCLPDGDGGWIVEHFTCPSHAVFDPNRNKCVWPELVSTYRTKHYGSTFY